MTAARPLLSEQAGSASGSAFPRDDLLRGASLFLDFDGTLVPIAERPDRVVVSATLRTLLRRLGEALDGRLAIISGRPVAEIDALLGIPALAVCGSHGLERRDMHGGTWRADRPAALDAALQEMRALEAADAALFLERKPLGVALHYRQAPAREADCVALATRLAEVGGLELQAGKMMIEVRVGGQDKGTALAALMRAPPMAGTRPVFVGDDLTDEPAFEAAQAMGGHGVVVATERASAARYRLETVEDVLQWLDRARIVLS